MSVTRSCKRSRQTRCADASAVNSVFITTSNELGAFESGIVAVWGGAMFSVVVGGVGTLIVVALAAVA